MLRIVNDQNDAVAGEVNKVWEDTSKDVYSSYFLKLDYSKFREDVDPQEIIQMLLWTAEGYMYDRQRFGSPPGLEDLMEKFRVWMEFYKKIAYKEEYLK